MAMLKELSYDVDIDTVCGLEFRLVGPDEKIQRSVVEITKTDTYVNNEPVYNGLFDKRMGVIDHNALCITCQKKNSDCPGHFGYISLAKPVFQAPFFDNCKKLLKCVCIRCSSILCDKTSETFRAIQSKRYPSFEKKWSAMFKLCSKVKKCEVCGARQPSKIFKGEGVLRIAVEYKEEAASAAAAALHQSDNGAGPTEEEPAAQAAAQAQAQAQAQQQRQVLTAEDVLRIFKRISDKDAKLLGFTPKYGRPEWMISTVLWVLPPSARPTVKTETGQRQEDDLTHKLINIIKANNSVKAKLEKGTKEQVDIMWQLLQYEVATYVDNNIPGIPPSQQRTGRPIRSVVERLKSKEGRFRGNLTGKRVDHSARSVITCDPNISIQELGVPRKIAMNLTFPEVYNKYNAEALRRAVDNGADEYPGAKYVRKTAERRVVRLKGMTPEQRRALPLEPGDVVERHLRTGDDWVLFNRQPSLHRMSMMGHRVHVMDFNTFRLNVCVTPNFNADFDGDEMNAHVPQSLQTMEELIQLASVPTQIISPRDCKPSISIVQDVCLGVNQITQDRVLLSQKQFFNLLAALGSPARMLRAIAQDPAHKNKKVLKWSGRQALSAVIPESVTLNQGAVVVRDGRILSGTFDKDTYQARTRGLVHSVYNDLGPDATVRLFDDTQRMICDFFVQYGASVGISDLVLREHTLRSFQESIRVMKRNVMDILEQVHSGRFENTSTKSNADFFEQCVNTKLNAANREIGEEGLKQITEHSNRMIAMVKAKSKGTTINVAQMIGCLGQQNVDGKRIPYSFDHRTLPHFPKFDDGPKARGFVENSFIRGLTPTEYFYHAMGGREGLIDTAVKSVTGDTQIVVLDSGAPRLVRIGDWVDAMLASAEQHVRRFEERQMELLDVGDDAGVFIPTTDACGAVSWGAVTAVTRHDPGDMLYRITTAGGRSVVVTESKSLLIWDAATEQLREVNTPDVKVGDLVPATACLPEPPTITSHIALPRALPCEEGGKSQPSMRLELDCASGRLLGMFMACASLAPGTAAALRNTADEGSRVAAIAFRGGAEMADVVGWMQQGRHPLPWALFIGKSEVRVVGYSEPHAAVLRGLTGDGEHLPAAAFAAPSPFVEGVLGGFLSGDLVLGGGGQLRARCKTRRLAEGLAMLCARVGVYADIAQDVQEEGGCAWWLRVSGPWLTKLATRVTVAQSSRGAALLLEATGTSTARDGPCLLKDVVLDAITHIETVDVALHPKVYDLTVPTTLNFGLANGLQVRDTSETGYIQRKLVKAMEDCKVSFDHTVRTTTGHIVQYLYGEDGMDAIKVESQVLPYVDLSPEQLRAEYWLPPDAADLLPHLAPGVAEAARMDPEFAALAERYFRDVEDDREFVIQKVHKGRYDKTIMYPVAFSRMITEYARPFEAATQTDLSPAHVLREIYRLCEEMRVNKHTPVQRFFKVLARCHLSPRRLIAGMHMSAAAFDALVVAIQRRFADAIINTSEMVGVISAQSIGEPCTQLTLNSVHYETPLLLRIDGKLQRTLIGAFVDRHLDGLQPPLLEEHPNDTRLGWLPDDRRVEVLSCDAKGKVAWSKVQAVTQHPVVNADGSNTLLRVTLRSGRQVVATKAKSFLQRRGNCIVQVDGSELRCGDYVPVARCLPMPFAAGFAVTPFTRKLARDAGVYFAALSLGDNGMAAPFVIDAEVLKDTFGQGPDADLPADLLAAPRELVLECVKAFFSTATIHGAALMLHNEIQVFVTAPRLRDSLQQLLLRLDVVSEIGEGVVQQTVGAPDSVLCVRGHHANALAAMIGARPGLEPTMFHSACTEPLDVVPSVALTTGEHLLLRRDIPRLLAESADEGDRAVLQALLEEDVLYDQVIKIEEVPNDRPFVYDLTVEGTRNFNTYTGICMADTFHLSGVSSASTAVRGVPRLKELLHCTTSKNIKTPVMTVYLRPEFQGNKSECVDIMNTLRTTRFRDVVKSSAIYFDPDDSATNIAQDADFVRLHHEVLAIAGGNASATQGGAVASPWLLRFEMDRAKLLDLRLTMLDIDYTLTEFYDTAISSVFSDDNAEHLVMRVRLQEGGGTDEQDQLTNLKALEQNIMHNLVLKGVRGINRVSLREDALNKYNTRTRTFEKQTEWIIDADGTNLMDMLANPFVDPTRTVSNDIHEICQVLGIEAARQALYNEIMDVLAQTTVNYRHIALLVDTMTSRGTLVSTDRHGINQGDIGPLAKCSFEETTDRLIKAGIFVERDNLNGVAANIMLGQIAPCGTGDGGVLVDEARLPPPLAPPLSDEEAEDEGAVGAGDGGGKDWDVMRDLAFDLDVDALAIDDQAMKKKEALVIF